MVKLSAIVISCCVTTLSVQGQVIDQDSLMKTLDNITAPRERADKLNELTIILYDIDAEKGYELASDAYEVSRDAGYLAGMRHALTMKGYYHYSKGDYTKAHDFYRESSALPMPDDVLLGYNLAMTGNAFRAQAEYDSALRYYQQSIDLLLRLKSNHYLAYAYKNLGRLYGLQWKNQEAREFLDKALQIYENEGSKFGIADTWFSIFDLGTNVGNLAEAGALVIKACSLANETKNDYLKLHCLINQGELQRQRGDYPRALQTLFVAMDIVKEKNMPMILADVFLNLGDIYEAMGQNDISLKYYLEALKIAERTGIKHEIAKVYSSIAWIYKNQHNFAYAHDYVDRSLELRKAIGDEHGISNCYNVLGIIYLVEKRYSEAIYSLRQALDLRRKIGHKEGVRACLFNLALVFQERQQYQQALEYQLQALAMGQEIGDKYALGHAYNSLGSTLTRLGRFREAELYLKKGNEMAFETGSRSLLMYNHLFFSGMFEARRDPVKALSHYKKYTVLNDSIYSENSANKLAELQALYQVEKKDREIELLNQQRRIQHNEILLQGGRIRQQNIIIASGVFGLVLFSLLAFLTYRYNRRIKRAHREIIEQKEEIQAQSEELIDANQTIAEINKKLEDKIEQRTLALSQAYKELDTFFYRSSHDFRRPLTTFLGLAEVAKITVKDHNALELFQKVKETANNLDKMLIKLQSISDVGSQQLIYKEVMVKEIFNAVCDTFRDEISRKGIRTSCEVQMQHAFISYPAMIKIIIENLVENGIHFSGVDKPFIKLTVSQTGDYVTMDFQDNGQGIPREYQQQVFDMYFRANERSKGNGLGLYIVKKAVEKLDGSITLSSIPLMGSTFTIMLPLAQSSLRIS
jgi:signal transduction histidine kinase